MNLAYFNKEFVAFEVAKPGDPADGAPVAVVIVGPASRHNATHFVVGVGIHSAYFKRCNKTSPSLIYKIISFLIFHIISLS